MPFSGISETAEMSDLLKAMTYGMSFSDYFNHLRIQHATVLMREKKEAGEPILVKEIALQSGFNNASSFYRAFERETGMTPKQWIKKL